MKKFPLWTDSDHKKFNDKKMTEYLWYHFEQNPPRLPTTFHWCLGFTIHVEIEFKENIPSIFGTVTALNPKIYKGQYKQPKGLLLDGAVIGSSIKPIKSVTIISTGKDVTKYIFQSFGPGL